MNVQQAQARRTELLAKSNDGIELTNEEKFELQRADTVIAAAADTVANMSEGRIKQELKNRGMLPSGVGFLSNPSVVLAGKVIGLLGIAALSAFGGMQYERRRGRGRNTSNSSDMADHSTSPQSHPATSPLDGRHFNHQGNPGNEGNTTNHPANRGSRNNAATTA